MYTTDAMNSSIPPPPGAVVPKTAEPPKPLWRRWGFILVALLILIGIIGALTADQDGGSRGQG